MIARPPARKYTITHDEIWEIVVCAEKQGGDKTQALKINKILEAMIKRHDS
jgi:hypothetical protein